MESNQEVRHEFDVPNTIHIRIIEYRNKDKSTMGTSQNKSEGSIISLKDLSCPETRMIVYSKDRCSIHQAEIRVI